MSRLYWVFITIQTLIIVQFIYIEQQIPGFVNVSFNEEPIPYDLLPQESAYFIATYLSSLAIHLILVEQIFRRRDGSIVWEKAGLRLSIQMGFTIFFHFLYIVLFSNLQTRHHVESVLLVRQFFSYRISITLIMIIPIVICLLLFKYFAWDKNAFILFSVGGIMTILVSLAIMYFEKGYMHGHLNDLEEERRIITNLLPIDIAIGFILWREVKRNKRLDNLEQSQSKAEHITV